MRKYSWARAFEYIKPAYVSSVVLLMVAVVVTLVTGKVGYTLGALGGVTFWGVITAFLYIKALGEEKNRDD